MKRFPLFAVLLLSLGIGTASTALAQGAPRTYAVLSLVGNTLNVHAVHHELGSRTGAATRNAVPVGDTVFDHAAVLATRALIVQARPGARPVLMQTEDAGLYKSQNTMFDDPAAHQDDRDYLKSLLQAQGVSHLLLVSTFRGNAELKIADTRTVGGGMLEGLGFYIDETVNLRNLDNSDVSRGIVVPFAYLRVRLLDARTLDLVAQATSKVHEVAARPSVESSGMDLWTSMDGAAKREAIERLIDDAIKAAVPALLQK